MRYSLYTLGLAMIFCLVANAQVSVVGGSGKTLRDLSGSGTFVTVVLTDKFGFARDMNLLVKSVNLSEGTITIERSSGEITAYRLADIREVRVQGGKVAVKEPKFRAGGSLTADQKKTVQRAGIKVRELFDAARDNQAMRIELAGILVALGDDEALEYLQSLERTDDLAIALDASMGLYLGGKEPDKDLIHRGLASGQRAIRSGAALVAGNTRDPQFTTRVRALLKTATNEEFGEIAVAAGLLEDTEAIPLLVDALKSLHTPKAEAAVQALKMLGGKEVEAAMLAVLEGSDDNHRLRALDVLYSLGDSETTREQAIDILKSDYIDSVVHGLDAAMILAPSGDWDAQERLRQFYNEPHDKDVESLVARARAAATLFEGGYGQAKNMLRELMNTPPDSIYAPGRTSDEAFKEGTVTVVQVAVCGLIARNGSRNLISLLDAPMQDPNPAVAYSASMSAIAIDDADFRFRLFE